MNMALFCRAMRSAWAKTQRPLPLSVSGGAGRGGGDNLGGECCVCMDAPIQAVSLLSHLSLCAVFHVLFFTFTNSWWHETKLIHSRLAPCHPLSFFFLDSHSFFVCIRSMLARNVRIH